MPDAIWTIDCVGAGGCDSDGGTRTASMTWMTPFEAFTLGIHTCCAVEDDLPPLKESAIDSPWAVLTFSPFLAAAVAAAAGMRLPTT